MFKVIARALVVLLFGSLLVALVACSPAATDAPAQQEDEDTETEAEAPESEEPESAEEVELTFWMSANPTLEAAMDDIIQGYMEANPNVTVRQEAFPFGEYFQKIFTAFAGGDAPDVFWIDVRTAAFAEEGLLLPLDDYVTDENRSDVIESAWKEATWQDTIYSIPLHQLTEALYVNSQMAEEAGIEIPTTVDDAWTWEEMVDITTQLTVREGEQTTVWGFGMERHLQDWPLTAIIYQGGGQPLSPDLTQAEGYLNSEETVAAINWITGMVRDHQVMPIEPIPDGFPTGQTAVYHATSTYRAALDNNFPDFEYQVAPLYVGPAGCAVTSGGWNVAIANTSEHPDVAWSLVDWMTRERHLEWVNKSGYLPIRTSVMSDPQFSESPWTIFLEELNECSVNRPPIPEYQLYNDLMNAAGIDIAIGGDAQAILDEIAAELDAEMSK